MRPDRRDTKVSRRRSASSIRRVQTAHERHAARPLCADSPAATRDAGGVRGGRGPHSRSGGRVMYAGKIARVVQGAVAVGCGPRCAARLGRRGRADQQREEAPVEEEDGLAEELRQPGTRRGGGGRGFVSSVVVVAAAAAAAVKGEILGDAVAAIQPHIVLPSPWRNGSFRADVRKRTSRSLHRIRTLRVCLPARSELRALLGHMAQEESLIAAHSPVSCPSPSCPPMWSLPVQWHNPFTAR